MVEVDNWGAIQELNPINYVCYTCGLLLTLQMNVNCECISILG